MPRIRWADLPGPVRHHLYERAIERRISNVDLARLLARCKSNPEAPDGPWYKDFGSFKLCGEGPYPKTFLTKGQVARGRRID